MAYQNFLERFAEVQGVESADVLLDQYAVKYDFQINSRARGRKLIDLLRKRLDMQFEGKKVLDVGCAYGSTAVECAKLGASVTGIDISDKWLGLAEVNAQDDAEVDFVNCDASSRRALLELAPRGPFDLIILNDVLEHIYDSAGLIHNIRALLSEDGVIYYKVPNGHATRNVLAEGHKKVFGISLLAPDYWHLFVKAPFQIYYRRREYFEAYFDHFGIEEVLSFNECHDEDIERTRRHVTNDLAKIRRHLKGENFPSRTHLAYARRACSYYFEEALNDLETMEWRDLFNKYRVTFWEGVLQRKSAT